MWTAVQGPYHAKYDDANLQAQQHLDPCVLSKTESGRFHSNERSVIEGANCKLTTHYQYKPCTLTKTRKVGIIKFSHGDKTSHHPKPHNL